MNSRDVLKVSELFSELDDNSLTDIAAAASIKKTSRGEVLFYEGDTASALYVVGSGKVKIFKLSSDGKEQILMIATPGDSFGEAAMFKGGKFPASAQSLEGSDILVLNRDRFISLLGRDPGLALNLIARLSTLLHKLNRLVEELSLTDISTRLSHYLIDRIDHEKTPGDRPVITLAEKKSVLASQLGTIPETLSRSLAKLSRENIIKVSGAEIEICDLDRLRELADK